MTEQAAATQFKTCTKCGRSLPVSEFHRAKAALHPHCRECKATYLAKWRADNEERLRAQRKLEWETMSEDARERKRKMSRDAYWANPARVRDRMLQQKYGIGLAEYDAMFAAQGGRCAICGAHPAEDKSLAVDHHHGTGQVRGLLCANCNNGLGRFKDDPALLARAITYLTETT